MTTMPLSFGRPPLSMNQRMHWAKKARITRELRHEAAVRARSMRLGPYRHITVTLHYQPRDNRRRDADNLVPSLKALCDGLVDAHLVPDDTPDLMTKRMPVIHPPVKGQPARTWLTIES